MARYRCAIVGCGPRAENHAIAYQHVPDGELVACCDLDAGRRTAFAARFHLAPYADMSALLQKEKPDLVHLVTMPDTRVSLMSAVSAAGVPACIVEKPIATGARDWKALVALSRTTRTKFAVGAQFRYHPNLTRCREALAGMGKVLFLEFSAGMNIANQGVHILDWAMSLNQDAPPRRVLAFASGVDRQDRGHLAPDSTAARVVFANGVEGMWTNGPTARRVFADDTTWKHCRVSAYAERGRVLYEEFGRWEISGPAGTESGSVTLEQARASNHVTQAALTRAVLSWIGDDRALPGTHLGRSLEQWNAILGVWASALERQVVDLPCDPPDDLAERCFAAFDRKGGAR